MYRRPLFQCLTQPDIQNKNRDVPGLSILRVCMDTFFSECKRALNLNSLLKLHPANKANLIACGYRRYKRCARYYEAAYSDKTNKVTYQMHAWHDSLWVQNDSPSEQTHQYPELQTPFHYTVRMLTL